MTFYKECLGGILTLQTIGESPLAGKMPATMKNYILQAILKNDTLILMASDMVADNGLKKGNSISLMLHCQSEREIYDCYAKLSENGVQTYPIAKTNWGAYTGNLTDKYGNHWLLNFTKVSGQQFNHN